MLYGRPDESCYKPSVCAVGGALVEIHLRLNLIFRKIINLP